MEPENVSKPELCRSLGMLDATAIVIGIVIGSGIFVLPNLIARNLPSSSAIFTAWILSGVLSFLGALAYAELGAMMPSTGQLLCWNTEGHQVDAAWRSQRTQTFDGCR